jgi:MORN repeat variant
MQRRAVHTSAFASLLTLLVITACNEPTDLQRARALIDSSRAVLRADSLKRTAVNDSLRDGPHTYRDKSGLILMEGEMRDGKRHGVWTSYWESGKVKSRSEYAGGKLNGLSTVFRENGELYYSGYNRDDHPVGEWRFFDGTGGLAKTVVYDSAGAVINDR